MALMRSPNPSQALSSLVEYIRHHWSLHMRIFIRPAFFSVSLLLALCAFWGCSSSEPEAGKMDGGAMDKGKMSGGMMEPGKIETGKMEAGAIDKGKMGGAMMEPGKMEGGAMDKGKVE